MTGKLKARFTPRAIGWLWQVTKILGKSNFQCGGGNQISQSSNI
jgi:hypothetical protein